MKNDFLLVFFPEFSKVNCVHSYTGQGVPTDQKNTFIMPRLTPEQRERAIGMKDMGATNTHIATTLACHRKTIENLFKRYRQTGRTIDRPRSGRPRVTSQQEDRHLRTLHLRNRFLTVAESAATALGRRVSPSTVTRRLRSAGIRACRPLRGVTLTRQHRRNRV